MDNKQNAIDIFDKLAHVYEDKFMDVSLYHDALDVFCKLIKKENGQVLEIACGPGNITKYLLQQRPDLEILATDMAPTMLELAKANNPTVEFQLLDGREISKLADNYDGVVCGFILPYFSEEDAGRLITDAYALLHAGGVLYISTMEENEDVKSGVKMSSAGDAIYMYYHNEDHLTRMMTKAGFSIAAIQRKEYAGPDGCKVTDLMMIATK